MKIINKILVLFFAILLNANLIRFYIETNRIIKAKKRLSFLESCSCEEFEELKSLIQKIN